MTYDIGIQRLQEVLGPGSLKIIEDFKEVFPDFADYVVKHAYGVIYNRPGINDKIREVAAVSNLIGQGVTGLPLATHIIGMLNVGWKKEEILEVILFLTGYSGYPRAIEAIRIAKEVFNSRAA